MGLGAVSLRAARLNDQPPAVLAHDQPPAVLAHDQPPDLGGPGYLPGLGCVSLSGRRNPGLPSCGCAGRRRGTTLAGEA